MGTDDKSKEQVMAQEKKLIHVRCDIRMVIAYISIERQ